jgi:hypothetical protein
VDLVGPIPQPFRLDDSRQARVHDRLSRLVGFGPAAFFYDACRLMVQTPPYESTTHLVAHMLREIESALRDVLEPLSGWPKKSKGRRKKSDEAHKDQVQIILGALRITDDDPVARMWLQLTGKSNRSALPRRAHRSSLDPPRRIDDEYQEFWNNAQTVLDAVLGKVEVRFLEYRSLLDELIAKSSPTGVDVDIFRNNVPNNLITANYFFDRLANPAWVELLRAAGIFKNVPEPVKSEKGMACPRWPPAEYLKRVASSLPDEVGKVLLEMPETHNWSAMADLTDVACLLPSAIAAQWAMSAKKWVRSHDFLAFGLPLSLGNLCVSLATDGEIAAALQLASCLLEVIPAREKEVTTDNLNALNIREPTLRFDLWEYEQILSKKVPILIDLAPDQSLEMLCDLLDKAILLSNRRGAERRPEDHSFIWRSAIEDHGQNLNHGLKDLLVTAIRSGVEQAVLEKSMGVDVIVLALEKRAQSWLIFQRIALHVLRTFSESASELVRRRLLDRALFDSSDVRHEYFLLEKECFGHLKKDEQETILMWIDKGPIDIEKRSTDWEEFTGKRLTPDDKDKWCRGWKRDRLVPIIEYLNPTWREFYAELLNQEGPAKHPDFTSYTEGGAFGPQSPESAEALAKLSPKHLVSYLLEWEPQQDTFRGATREGLGRRLTSLVSENPLIYTVEVDEFKRLAEPTYIRAVIQGFQNSLNGSPKFDWPPILDLCVWAATRGREIPGRRVEHLEMDPHWGWTRGAVIRLLNEGFSAKNFPIPWESREAVWKAIETIVADPNPSPDDEEKWIRSRVKDESRGQSTSSRGSDVLTNAINSVRGTAVECVINYALWVRKHFEASNDERALTQGFGSMAEVQSVLDRHLDTDFEPSIAVRAIYGERIPWLQLLDPGWAARNTDRIFPRGEQSFWHAAWDTYICYCGVYDSVFEWLEGEYLYAIEQIGSHTNDWENLKAPDYSLSQHLMNLMWRGSIRVDSEILAAFFRAADAELRAHALGFVGKGLRTLTEPIPDETAIRLMNFWEKRFQAASSKPETWAKELSEFGWWFASGKFADEWATSQLLQTLAITNVVEADMFVVERLAEIAQTMPVQCVSALKLMVEGSTKGWGVVSWRERITEIIRAARKSGSADARQIAEELVNLLSSMGYFQFGELLKDSL